MYLVKRVVLVAAHFPPSNLSGVHRARLWAQHLHEFGWQPIIVTTHWRHYEERLDWELCELLDADLEIIRTAALPTKPLRVVGDIGIRGFAWHLATLRRLIRKQKIDFLHITVPSFYSALLGEFAAKDKRIAFGIDYIDPWVHVWPEAEQRYSRAWVSMKLGEVLEPRAVRQASLITGITEGYYSGVFERNRHLHRQAIAAAMPYGNSVRDFEIVARKRREAYLFNPNDGAFHLIYAGAMLPKGYRVLDCLLAAVAQMRTEYPDQFSRLRIHFVGTGKSPDEPAGYNIRPRATLFGLDEIISEHPQRVPYVDVLSHLVQATAILIIGSTEAHYSPSKIYQSVQAKRPIFALLHEASTAIQVIERSNAGVAIPLTETTLPEPKYLASRLAAFISDIRYSADKVEWSKFEAYSARESTRRLALAMDAARERFAHFKR
jgi:hypothetical protein